jgi:hypothetical protein
VAITELSSTISFGSNKRLASDYVCYNDLYETVPIDDLAVDNVDLSFIIFFSCSSSYYIYFYLYYSFSSSFSFLGILDFLLRFNLDVNS